MIARHKHHLCMRNASKHGIHFLQFPKQRLSVKKISCDQQQIRLLSAAHLDHFAKAVPDLIFSFSLYFFPASGLAPRCTSAMCMNLIAVSFFLLVLRWQRYYKLCLIVITLGYDPTSVKLYDLTGNGKPQSCTACLCRTGIIQAIEFFKNRLRLAPGIFLPSF